MYHITILAKTYNLKQENILRNSMQINLKDFCITATIRLFRLFLDILYTCLYIVVYLH